MPPREGITHSRARKLPSLLDATVTKDSLSPSGEYLTRKMRLRRGPGSHRVGRAVDWTALPGYRSRISSVPLWSVTGSSRLPVATTTRTRCAGWSPPESLGDPRSRELPDHAAFTGISRTATCRRIAPQPVKMHQVVAGKQTLQCAGPGITNPECPVAHHDMQGVRVSQSTPSPPPPTQSWKIRVGVGPGSGGYGTPQNPETHCRQREQNRRPPRVRSARCSTRCSHRKQTAGLHGANASTPS